VIPFEDHQSVDEVSEIVPVEIASPSFPHTGGTDATMDIGLGKSRNIISLVDNNSRKMNPISIPPRHPIGTKQRH